MLERDPDRVRAIVSALSDEYSRKIFSATINEAKSPEEICSEQGVPVSTCYRKIHELVSLSILRVAKIEIKDSKKLTFYRSEFKNILINLESNNLVVELVPNIDPSMRSITILGVSSVTQDTVHDCDVCMLRNVLCKVFVSADSVNHLFICQECERKITNKDESVPLDNTFV